MLKCIFLLVFVWFTTAKDPITKEESSEYVSYIGHQMWRLNMKYNPDVEKGIRNNISRIGLLRWHEGGLELSVPPQDVASMGHYARTHNVTYQVTHENLGQTIAMERDHYAFRRQGLSSQLKMTEMDIDLVLLNLTYLNESLFSYKTIGHSVQGRAIKMFVISSGDPNNVNVLVEAGQHPDEWSSILNVLYAIAHFANHFNDPDFPSYMKNNNWHFIPLVNPDGYEYTQKTDRFWHKNRRLYAPTDAGECEGVDIGRNFGYKWGNEDGSIRACSMNFDGYAAESEPETRALSGVLDDDFKNFFGYISMHAFGRRIITPWIYSGRPTQSAMRHKKVAGILAKRLLAQHGKVYPVGTVDAGGIERVPGTSVDWAYSENIIHSYFVRMGDDVFALPHDKTEESLEETITLLYALGDAI